MFVVLLKIFRWQRAANTFLGGPQFGRPRAMAVVLQKFIKFGPGGGLKWLAIAS